MTGEDAAALAFRARALAQAHALSATAQRLVNRAVAEEAETQPRPELGAWAGAAFTQGYCLRRVEEDGEELAVAESDDESLDRAATAVVAELRRGTADDMTVAALDLLVASQVEHRLEPWRDELDDATWADLEQYLTWWVVKGYGLRVAETSEVGP
ncbi:MAG: hypothetical protein M3517_12830 [Actinomycetota bacterium]|nr:hypothetical protein [Acidimicrobiia bacterium]MDQ3312982.1 hypothetical protein [Actinomycetota bacterium]